MIKERVCIVATAALMLLTGCASKTPAEPTTEPVPEMPALEAREAYQLAEIPVQELHDGDEVTVDGVCTFTVKGFGAGKTITADGLTCAGAKAGQTLVWVTCDYVNLTQDEVSPGRLVENAVLRLESGSADGKSASFAQILHGEPAEIYIYYAIPEDLPEQSLTAQFTINDQTYSYELPADRAGTLPPALPEPEEPEAEPEPEPITLQEKTKTEEIRQQEQPTQSQQETSSQTDDAESENIYTTRQFDDAGRVVRISRYSADGQLLDYTGYEYDSAGQLSASYTANAAGVRARTTYYENGVKVREEHADGSGYYDKYDEINHARIRVTLGPGGVTEDTRYFYEDGTIKIVYADGTIFTTP